MFKHHCSRPTTIISLLLLLTMPLVAAAEPAPVDSPLSPATQSAKATELPAPGPATQSGAIRVGYADIMKIAEQSDAGKVAKAHFEVKADKIKAQIETKQKILEKQKTTLEAKLPSYSPEQRAAKIKEFEKKVDELRKMLQKADKEMKPMQEELLKGIYGKIEAAARSYGEANGFTVILIKSELLYLGKNTDVQDVTEALLQQVNKKTE